MGCSPTTGFLNPAWRRSLHPAGWLQAVCHMLYGCGALRHDPGPLLQAVTNDMLRRPAAYEQRDWVRILWAFGTLNYSPGEQLFNAFHRQVCSLGAGHHEGFCSACVAPVCTTMDLLSHFLARVAADASACALVSRL